MNIFVPLTGNFVDTQQNKTSMRDSDVKLLSSLIVEFNIARRNIGSYPKDHPLITASLNKVIQTYNQLLEQDGVIVIGVARNVLMVNDVLLEKNNLIFKDFAKVLFEHGIGALTLRRGLSLDELRKFYEILCLKREELLNMGGISLIWEQASITSLEMQPIRYDLFRATGTISPKDQQKPPQGLWERFAQKLVQRTFDTSITAQTIGKSKENGTTGDVFAPEALALILNHRMGISGQGSDTNFRNGMTALFRELTETPFSPETEMAVPYEELALFINALNPGLRRLFLNSSLETGSIQENSLAGKLISRLSAETLTEILEDAGQNRFAGQSRILELLRKLGSNGTQQYDSFSVIPGDTAEVHQKIRSIFREDSAKDFVPDSYLKALNRIMAVDHGHRIELSEITDLLDTFDSHFVENQISNIIVRIMVQNDDPEQITRLADNLDEIFLYLLETGDYEQIINLIEQCGSPEILPEVCNRLRQTYTSQEYLNEMLIGLSTWGKLRYGDISHLISMIGEPFIEVLLDRLAVEENLSLRRFLMDRIQEFGPLARDAMFARLSDKRWFVLRNMIIMLQRLDDITILEHIRPLLRNGHQRVRQEALRACLLFNDPSAERQILHDMDCSDRETQLAAINLADKSRSGNVFKKLLEIIGKPGFNSIECELKSAAAHALAEIGKPEALPELARLLASKSLLHPRLLTRLKIDVVRSMCLYPPAVVRPILTRLASGSGEVARQVQLSLKMIMEKTT
jgi:HEAT repeat protein